MKYIIYKIIVFIVRPLFKLVYRPTVIGASNIPAIGPTIIASNHKSQLDAGSMLYTPKRVVHVLGKKELFKTKNYKLIEEKLAHIELDIYYVKSKAQFLLSEIKEIPRGTEIKNTKN